MSRLGWIADRGGRMQTVSRQAAPHSGTRLRHALLLLRSASREAPVQIYIATLETLGRTTPGIASAVDRFAGDTIQRGKALCRRQHT